MKLVIYETNLTKCEQFTKVFKNMKLFAEKVNISFDTDKLYLQTMDKSNISICELTLPKSWFDEYSLAAASETIGVNTTILYKILSTRDKQAQRIILTYDDANSDVLGLEFVTPSEKPVVTLVEEPKKKSRGKKAATAASDAAAANVEAASVSGVASVSGGERKNVFDKEFELPLYGIDSEMFQIPKQEYDAEVTIDSATLFATINQLKNFSDTVDVKFTEEGIVMTAHSIESGKMDVIIHIDDVESFEIVEGANINMSFSLNYLYNICAFYEVSKHIKISVLEEFPIQFTYDLGDNGIMQFYLAPKETD